MRKVFSILPILAILRSMQYCVAPTERNPAAR